MVKIVIILINPKIEIVDLIFKISLVIFTGNNISFIRIEKIISIFKGFVHIK